MHNVLCEDQNGLRGAVCIKKSPPMGLTRVPATPKLPLHDGPRTPGRSRSGRSGLAINGTPNATASAHPLARYSSARKQGPAQSLGGATHGSGQEQTQRLVVQTTPESQRCPDCHGCGITSWAYIMGQTQTKLWPFKMWEGWETKQKRPGISAAVRGGPHDPPHLAVAFPFGPQPQCWPLGCGRSNPPAATMALAGGTLTSPRRPPPKPVAPPDTEPYLASWCRVPART